MAPYPKAVDAWNCVSLASPVFALAVNVLAQLVLFRVRRGAGFFRCIVESAVIGAMSGLALAAGLLVTAAAPVGSLLPTAAVNALTYLALSYCYYHFVQLGQTSIRIRLYAEIAASEHGLTAQDIARRYDNAALMQMRLQRLLESGDIVSRNGRYFAGRTRFVQVAKILFVAKRFMLGRNSEFEGMRSEAAAEQDSASRKKGTRHP